MNLKLELALEEVNKILVHLDNGIHKEVAALIAKIKSQAIPQLEKESPKKEEVKQESANDD